MRLHACNCSIILAPIYQNYNSRAQSVSLSSVSQENSNKIKIKMAPDQKAVETFMGITGADEVNAIQTLEEHKGNLNNAVNAYFREEGSRRGRYMETDDPLPSEVNEDDSRSFPNSQTVHARASVNEKMIHAAIEFPEQEVEMLNQDTEDPATEDAADLARAVSLSLQMEDEFEDVEYSRLVKRRRIHASSAPPPDNNTLPQQKAEQEAEAVLKEMLEKKENERQLAAKEASLPQEPTCDDANAVTLLVRMPDGSKRERRFLYSEKLQSLFDFIDVGRGYRLVRQYPRRAFGYGERSTTIGELGLTSKKEAFYLEWI